MARGSTSSDPSWLLRTRGAGSRVPRQASLAASSPRIAAVNASNADGMSPGETPLTTARTVSYRTSKACATGS